MLTSQVKSLYSTESLKLYLTHLPMQRDSSDAEVPQQQRHPLGCVTRAAENNKGVPGQLVQDGNQVAVLLAKPRAKLTEYKTASASHKHNCQPMVNTCTRVHPTLYLDGIKMQYCCSLSTVEYFVDTAHFTGSFKAALSSFWTCKHMTEGQGKATLAAAYYCPP